MRYYIQLAVASEIGLCKKENQDRLLARVGEGPTGDFGLFVVADGMGSQRGGSQAAETAILFLDNWWNTTLPQLVDNDVQSTVIRTVHSLQQTGYQINTAVMQLGTQLNSSPGTTLSILFFYGGIYGFVHIGDSRIYKIERSIESITPDDTWVASQIRRGAMTVEQAEHHPQRHVLTQCAGLKESVEIHTGMGTLNQGGFVLCSDGFYHHLDLGEIASLSQYGTLEHNVQQAVAAIYQRGATDNLSAVVLNVQQGS